MNLKQMVLSSSTPEAMFQCNIDKINYTRNVLVKVQYSLLAKYITQLFIYSI